MNWKLKLSLVFAAILMAVVIIKLPSEAQSDKKSLAEPQNLPVVEGNVTRYPNGVSKVEPDGFGVSGNVRDMPTVDPDALVKSANFKDTETRLEERKEELRKSKGIVSQEGVDDEVNEQNAERVKQIIPGAGIGDRDFQDPLVNKKSTRLRNSPEAMPGPSLTFDGATQADNASQGACCSTPPDPNGDVGLNHYVSSVNVVLKMFYKDGTLAAGPIKTNSLFSALPEGNPCRTLNDGDPIVLYDTLADRWHISQFGLPSASVSYQCVAVSVTGDPTGAYYVWSYVYPLANAVNDYPKVGVWTDGYHMTFNQFQVNASNGKDIFVGLGVLTQDRKKALAGDPSAGAVYVNIGGIDPALGGSLPGDIDGYIAPPPGMAEIIGTFLAVAAGDPIDGLRIFKWIPNFDNPGSSSLTILPDVPLAPFDARQPPTTSDARSQIEVMGAAPTQYLDSVADRSMHRFAYRNFGTMENPINAYVGNFSVNVSGVKPISAATYQTGIRWFEVRRTNDTLSVFDQGTHNLTPGDGANGLNNWLGSNAQDNRGDIALGFSQAGTTQKADIKIAGRTNNVANSGTLNEGEALMHAATGIQTRSSGRWGDYSAMSIDPSDDCTFWYTNEYYAVNSTNNWSTRVGKFRFPQCVNAPKATITGTVTSCETGAPLNKASVDATGGFNRITNANGTYSIIVSPGTYSVSTGRSAGGLFNATQNTTVANGQTATVNICISSVASQTPQVVSESCGVPNNFPDPGEQLTVSLPLQNPGSANTGNLTATLQATGGVTNPSGAQTYGAIAPGSTVTRNFNFTVNPNVSCGSPVTLTFIVTDGTNNYGTVTKTYVTGARTQTFSESFDGVTAPALPAGWTNTQIKGTGINWVTTTTTPSSPPNAAFANDSTTPNTSALVSPAVQIQIPDAQLSFKNKYQTEFRFDGMVLEFSTDNGQTWADILTGGGSFASGGYNYFIAETDSTLTGRRAWTGNVGNSYIDTVVNLPASLNGQSVKFRWLMATDTDNVGPAVTGVEIDDVKVFGTRQSCNAPCSSGPTACRFQRRADFDGDGKSDVSVFRPDNGFWYLLNSSSGFTGLQFGISTDRIVPADYDGDGKTDIAVWRTDGTWYMQRSRDGFNSVQFGSAGDVPMPADFDGDGKAELVVFRPSNGTWYTLNLVNGAFNAVQFGSAEDKPVVGDYDGDCKADYAVYRPSNGVWYMLRSRDGFTAVQFGNASDRPVVGDYDGDGKSDVAIFRPSESNWYLLRSTQGFGVIPFGSPGDIPAPADYDGDDKTDVAVFRPNGGNWYQLRSSQGFYAVQFGASGDRPVPGAYVP